MKILIAALFILVISSTIYSQADWVSFYETKSGNWYYDRNSILKSTTESNVIKVWMKLYYSIPMYDKLAEKYSEYVLYQYMFYCSPRLIELTTMVVYFADGSVVSKDYDNNVPESIVPDTPPDGLLKIICE